MILNPALYEQVKREANLHFAVPSAYKSGWIVREYKRRGGTYADDPNEVNETGSLSRWFKEKWVDMNRPITKNGKIIGYQPCGRKSPTGKYPYCRPTYRISKDTPTTWKEAAPSALNSAKKKKRRVKSSEHVYL